VVRVLERLGHRVTFPSAQTCCGQLHLNSGFPEAGLSLARRLAEVLERSEVIVCPSGSCTAMIRHHCLELAPRVFEFSEFLVDRLRITDTGAYFPHRVAYHASCHSLRYLGIESAPRRLLEAVDAIDLVEIERETECCGFGGTFAIKNPDVSAAMLTDKVADLIAVRAEFCTATDNSCLMHIDGGLMRARAGIRAVHVAEILSGEVADG
jgi:L-lactate dehydrogenase complex protein LldE